MYKRYKDLPAKLPYIFFSYLITTRKKDKLSVKIDAGCDSHIVVLKRIITQDSRVD